MVKLSSSTFHVQSATPAARTARRRSSVRQSRGWTAADKSQRPPTVRVAAVSLGATVRAACGIASSASLAMVAPRRIAPVATAGSVPPSFSSALSRKGDRVNGEPFVPIIGSLCDCRLSPGSVHQRRVAEPTSRSSRMARPRSTDLQPCALACSQVRAVEVAHRRFILGDQHDLALLGPVGIGQLA